MAVANMEGVPAEKFAFGGFFPIKRLKSKFSNSEGGEWLVAYRAEQRRQLRAVLSSLPVPYTDEAGSGGGGGANEETPHDTHLGLHSCLDREFVLHHLHVDSPSDVAEINISGCGLFEGEPEGLRAFSGVVKVVASENKLPLELFDSFECLNELELSLNGIIKAEVTRGSFKHLQVLDLSYNSVSDATLLALGTLPALKELHLTGNSLVVLPPDMSRPFVDAHELGRSEMLIRFPCLEKLWLEENQLTDMATFAVLAGMKRLKELYLDNNELYGVPQLKLLGVNTVDESPSLPSTQDGRLSRGSVFTPVVETRGESSGGGGGATGAEGGKREASDTQELPLVADAGQPRWNRQLAQLPPPFPLLELLSITNNLVLCAESLVPLKTWPRLKQLRIQGNPLTFTCKGMPPVLQRELVEGRGVGVIRRASDLRKKPHLSLAEKSKDLKKVPSSLPPLIPKPPLPLPLPLEAGPTQQALMVLGPPHLPAIEESRGDCSDSATTSEQRCPEERGAPNDEQEKTQSGVFLTQIDVDDRSGEAVPVEQVAPCPSSPPPPHESAEGAVSETLQGEFDCHRREERERWKHLPSKYKGYEALLSAVPDASVVVPKDLQTCSAALRHLLKHTLTLPNPRAVALGSNAVRSPLQIAKRLQRTEMEQDGRHQEVSSLQVNVSLPQKVRQLEEILSEIKHQCLEVDMSLSDILSTHEHKSQQKAKKHVQLQRDASVLLGEVQRRFDDIRRTVAQCDPQNRPVPPTLQEP